MACPECGGFSYPAFNVHFNALLLFFGFVPPLSCSAPPPLHQIPTNLVPIIVKNSPDGNFFDVDVTLGNSISSDLWVARPGFQCFDRLNSSQLAPSRVCMYEIVPKYDPTISSTFSKLKNETFGVHYGAGIALGVIGTEERSYLERHLGLGYPILASAHPGNSVPNDTISLLTNKVLYEQLLFCMHTQGLIPGWFSLALNRLPREQLSRSGGVMGLGALPNATTSGPFVSAPVEVTEALPVELTGGKISEWTLTVQDVIWSAGESSKVIKTNTTSFQAVVDSGNFFNQLPQKIANEVNAEFTPPATYGAVTDSYIVACDAIPPSFGITIAGTIFSQHSDDMIFQLPNGGSPNNIAVFDFGNDEMRFAQRADRGAVSNGTTNSTTIVPSMTSSAGQRESARVRLIVVLLLLAWGIGFLIL
ncbi:acid protease [Xylaria sp. FL0933]|nr:acid protease [Xylaria sp. FL0933]